MSETGVPPAIAGDPIASLVREADFDRYASALFAPAEARAHLLALYAFDAELARVWGLVSDPMVGELRLQWWRDALNDPERADAVAHPVARALEGAIRHGRLPRQALLDLIDARADDLYDDPIATLADLEGRIGATSSVVLRLASLICAEGADPGGAEAAGFAGVAQGLARLLRRLPRSQMLLPVDRMAAHGVTREDLYESRASPELSRLAAELRDLARRRLAEARSAAAAVDPVAAPAFLPVALVAGDLDRLDRADSPLAPPPERARWRRLLQLWRASRRTPPF